MPKSSKRRRAYIGIDIGGTKSLYALFDERFEVLASEKLPTQPDEGATGGFDRRLRRTVKRLVRTAKDRGLKVRAIGIGFAGRVDMRKARVRKAGNLAFLEGYAFRDALEGITDATVFAANDVLCGLYGEHLLGCARKARHAIAIFIGTGIGGALLLDGRLYVGARGMAGDIGNYLLHVRDGPGEHRKEVLDSVASRPAIAGDAAALAARRKAPKLKRIAGTDVNDIKSGDIAAAIRKGDKAVEKLVRGRAALVGSAISNLVDFLNPDHIVLGGGIVEAMPELMRREIERSIQAHAAPRAAEGVKVCVAKLHNHAVTAGAALLACNMDGDDPPLEL
jgi:glucokinase